MGTVSDLVATNDEISDIFDLLMSSDQEQNATQSASLLLARFFLRLLQSNFINQQVANCLYGAVTEVSLPIDVEDCLPERCKDALQQKKNSSLLTQPAFIEFRQNLITVLLPHVDAPAEALLPNNYRTIAEAFGLSLGETACLFFVTLCDRTHIFDRMVDLLLERIGIAALLGLIADESEAEMATTLKSGRLYTCGLVRRKGAGTFSECLLITEIGKVVLSHNFQTSEDLRDFIMQSIQRSKLAASNFIHVLDYLDTGKALLGGTHAAQKHGVNILLYGSPGTGKTEFAKVLVQEAGLDARMIGEFRNEFETFDSAARLDHFLMVQRVTTPTSKDVMIFDEAEDLFLNGGFSQKRTEMSKLMLNRLFEQNQKPVIWIVNDLSSVPQPITRRMTACFGFERPPQKMRLQIAADICRGQNLKVPRKALKQLDDTVPLNPGLVVNAAKQVKLTGFAPKSLAKAYIQLWEAYHEKRFPKTDYNQIIEFELHLCNTDRDLSIVRTMLMASDHQAFAFCLHGAPGTGKSLFAKWLCRQLDVRPIEHRASDLISPYVGRTEANIRAAFENAKDKGAALIIDEADTFLFDRAEAVRTFEVSMVNEILRALEDHPLPVFCTTNRMDELDLAAIRRFTFKIGFKPLTSEQINLAYRQFFELEAPEDILRIENLTPSDFATVDRRCKLLNIPKSDAAAIAAEVLDEARSKGPLSPKIGFR